MKLTTRDVRSVNPEFRMIPTPAMPSGRTYSLTSFMRAHR